MSFQPYDFLEDASFDADRFWSLVKSDHRFYRLTRAYNTIGRVLHEAHVQEDLLFDEADLKRERLHIRDALYASVNQSAL